jgi:uncharacterized protein (DUF486 family)
MFQPIVLLFISNLFMTFAWYGHLKTLKGSPLWMVILVSWAIAFLLEQTAAAVSFTEAPAPFPRSPVAR